MRRSSAGGGAVKIPVSVKLPMRLTNVFALSSALLGYGARGVVFFNRFFEPDVDVERMTFVESSPYSEPTELRNVLRMVAICSAVLPQLDLSVSTGVHDGEAAVKALLCGAEAVQVCTAIHQKGFEVIAEMNEYIDRWAERRVSVRSMSSGASEFQERHFGHVPARTVYEVFPVGGEIVFAEVVSVFDNERAVQFTVRLAFVLVFSA